jgi:RimJ/RimL family protein N-acetyltransferase
MPDGRLRLERLDLVLLEPATLAALLDGERGEAESLLGAVMPPDWPDEHDRHFLRFRLGELDAEPAAWVWSVRAVILRAEAQLAGHVGFHGPPGANGIARPGALEIGYTIFPGFRRRGYATEAAAGLLRWAQSERGISSFLASVAPANDASLGVIARLGFQQIGERWDDLDGLELVFERLEATSPPQLASGPERQL